MGTLDIIHQDPRSSRRLQGPELCKWLQFPVFLGLPRIPTLSRDHQV